MPRAARPKPRDGPAAAEFIPRGRTHAMRPAHEAMSTTTAGGRCGA